MLAEWGVNADIMLHLKYLIYYERQQILSSNDVNTRKKCFESASETSRSSCLS